MATNVLRSKTAEEEDRRKMHRKMVTWHLSDDKRTTRHLRALVSASGSPRV